jgi:hypothetical protein
MQLTMKNAEVKLMESLSTIHVPSGWRACHFHLNKLLEQYQSEYQSKIAVNLIHDLLVEYEGGIFLFADQSIVVLCSQLDKLVQNKLIFQLRYLYMDDPLAYTDDGQENPEFCTVYDLGRDWQEFFEWASRRMALSVRKNPASERPAVKAHVEGSPQKPADGLPAGLSVSVLANIERDLQHADLSRVIRKQPVCAVLPGNGGVRRVFDELYIHIAHLRQMLRVDVDFFSNRWLFKYLTQILDRRMIALIKSHPGRFLEHPISLNLNVETLLSPAFADFDAGLKDSTKISMVIEVPAVDIFADTNAFMLARGEAQKLGYRVCLDGLTTESFLHIDREKLGLNLIKVQWNADPKVELGSEQNRALAAAITRCGTNRIILCRCDNRAAVEYGQALGISLFQGRYIDSLLDPEAKVQN